MINNNVVVDEKELLHPYLGGEKPWKNINEDKAKIWWQYAKQTPYYKEIKKRLKNKKTGKWYQNIFSVKNFDRHKVFTLAGIKIKIKRGE